MFYYKTLVLKFICTPQLTWFRPLTLLLIKSTARSLMVFKFNEDCTTVTQSLIKPNWNMNVTSGPSCSIFSRFTNGTVIIWTFVHAHLAIDHLFIRFPSVRSSTGAGFIRSGWKHASSIFWRDWHCAMLFTSASAFGERVSERFPWRHGKHSATTSRQRGNVIQLFRAANIIAPKFPGSQTNR